MTTARATGRTEAVIVRRSARRKNALVAHNRVSCLRHPPPQSRLRLMQSQVAHTAHCWLRTVQSEQLKASPAAEQEELMIQCSQSIFVTSVQRTNRKLASRIHTAARRCFMCVHCAQEERTARDGTPPPPLAPAFTVDSTPLPARVSGPLAD